MKGGEIMEWEIVRVRYGEEKEYLKKEWEPFGVTSEIITNNFQSSYTGRNIIEVKSNDYVYLRKMK